MNQLKTKCRGCDGTGYNSGTVILPGGGEEPGQTTCIQCQGTGKTDLGELPEELITFLNDLKDKVDDVMDKCNDIFEKVNE